jgi:asparagine synthase (glutamine-hydrolysing)
MQEVNGFAALLSSSLDLQNITNLMAYRSWQGLAVKRSDNISLGLCLINADTGEFSAIHGEFYGPDISSGSVDNLSKMLASSDGSYSFVLPVGDALIFARDQLGTKPLYYASSNSSFGVSSDAKVLKKFFSIVNLVEPGVLYKATQNSLMQFSFNTLNHHIKPVEPNEALHNISALLDESVKRRVVGKRKIVLGFSGGLDSVILSILAKKYAKVEAATVCMRDSLDYKVCENIADKLGIDLKMIVVDAKLINDTIKKLHRIMQFDGAMHASIACVVHLLARFTRNENADALILGQFADELFGGYARYLKYLRSSVDKVSNAMFNDVKNAHKDNFCRDETASSPLTRLLLPYTALDLVKYVVNIPVDLKLNSKTGARKIILREVAKALGIDNEIASREKRAMQFSSGIHKIVSKQCISLT